MQKKVIVCEFIRKIKSEFSKVQANNQEPGVSSDVLIGLSHPQNNMGSAHFAPHAVNKPAWCPKILIFLKKVAQPEQTQRSSISALLCTRSWCHPVVLSAWLCFPLRTALVGAALSQGQASRRMGAWQIQGTSPFQPGCF